MFGNMIGLSGFSGRGFRREDLILLCFGLQIANDNMLKPNNEICLKCKYQQYSNWKNEDRINYFLRVY